MKSLDIALLTYSTKPRGSVIHTLELAEALHNRGHRVCIYALDKDGQGFDRPVACEVRLIPTQPAAADLDQLIQQRTQEFIDFLVWQFRLGDRPHQIYHAQDCLSANAVLQFRESVGRKYMPCIVRTIHHIEAYTSPYLRDCQDRSIRQADLCLCVSQHWQQQIYDHYGIHTPRVNNGINVQRFASTAMRQDSPELQGDVQAPVLNPSQSRAIRTAHEPTNAPTHPDPFRFLTVGGIEPRKNSINLVRAFAKVKAAYPDTQLVIVGGATLFDYQAYRDEFFEEVSRLNLRVGEDLLLPGVVPDAELPGIYQSAHAFIFPSLKEGWGMVVLEAIASRLPVIVSQQPPFTEFLEADQALWVDPAASDSIAEAMLRVTEEAIASSLRERSQSVLPRYSWSASAQLHETHYRQYLASIFAHKTLS
ncbi:MAG: MSMEG_0565 family glycosyltransferase [Elainellaceae cyanobacterium]